MVLGSSDASRVTLVAKDILMQQQAEMNLFDITKYQMVNMTYPEKGVKMVIKFRRKIMSEMMTTYLPSILLMMITFATTLFKPFFFEAALSVNLTTMLVMTNIFISKMEGLPPTSDIKMIDIWLVLCQMVPFAEVVLLTAMEYHRKDKTKEKDRKKRGKKKSKKNRLSQSVSITIVSEADNQDHRKDDDLEQRGEPSLQISLKDNEEDDSARRCCQRRWIPDLKTVGRCFSLLVMPEYILMIILSEKKVLPCLVLASYIVYFAIALNFYFDY